MRLTQIDAFTSVPFRGNPAAVCVCEDFPEDRSMQALATEMNLSETAFLVPASDGFQLRWFTPALEVDLCGHATLASAHFLWQSGTIDDASVARFHTRSGVLTARRSGDWIEMDLPAQPPQPIEATAVLTEALGAQPAFVGHNEVDWLIELAAEQQVRDLVPDISRLMEIDARGFIVTAASSDAEFDFVSRFFAPAAGVAEDPVTGSAHCCLGPYWSDKLGRRSLVGYQASARGGVVRVTDRGDRVTLAGQAVTVATIDLQIEWP